MTPKQILQALLVLVVLAALGAGVYAAWRYTRMSGQIADLRSKADELDDLKQQVNTLSDELAARSKQDAAIRDRRASITLELNKAANEDPVVAGYLDQPIPDGVRQALRR